MTTILEKFYHGLDFDHIKDKLNPFLSTRKWLEDTCELSEKRRQQIKDLFGVENVVTAEKITEIGPNLGKYPAYLAIAHGLAEHDGNGGLRKIDNEFWNDNGQNNAHPSQPIDQSTLPTEEMVLDACDKSKIENYTNVTKVCDLLAELHPNNNWQDDWRDVVKNEILPSLALVKK